MHEQGIEHLMDGVLTGHRADHGGCTNMAQNRPWRVYEQGTEKTMEGVLTGHRTDHGGCTNRAQNRPWRVY